MTKTTSDDGFGLLNFKNTLKSILNVERFKK